MLGWHPFISSNYYLKYFTYNLNIKTFTRNQILSQSISSISKYTFEIFEGSHNKAAEILFLEYAVFIQCDVVAF